MWTIKFRIMTDEGFKWEDLEWHASREEAEQAFAEYTAPEGEAEWFLLVESEMLYDEMYNAAYCPKCSGEMRKGEKEWADPEYLERLQVYTIPEFKAMINKKNPRSKDLKRFGFSRWTCGCCEQAFMGH